MNKKIIALSLAVIGIAAIAPMVFAQTTTVSGVGAPTQQTMPPVKAPATTQAKIACVGTAVNARESAIDAGYNTYSAAMNAAYSARATALSAAYANATSSREVAVATRAAWAAYTSAAQSASTAWSTTRDGAWNTFYVAVAACKAPSSVTNG